MCMNSTSVGTMRMPPPTPNNPPRNPATTPRTAARTSQPRPCAVAVISSGCHVAARRRSGPPGQDGEERLLAGGVVTDLDVREPDGPALIREALGLILGPAVRSVA